ncbi:TonB-dependent receptor [Chelativorans sp. AA-79]|uniref:TonB-dependent receptor n=1 Tax=Chelativorans sp. AA-79 TaxID=3028735 RepID=UPI0023F64AA5|nr:TonB-dependent receptor [Chelativorans sp. AA-79]WEX10577.1 TonB-dependent receptor [Chelativorans sp. AA-79]
MKILVTSMVRFGHFEKPGVGARHAHARGGPDLRLLLLAGTALAGLIAAPSLAAAEEPGKDGKVVANSAVRPLPVGENTEAESPADKPAIPFMISVDGETIDKSADPTEGEAEGTPAAGAGGPAVKTGRLAPGETPSASSGPPARPVDRQRRTDVSLAAVDIQVKFDGLEAEPMLNVSTMPVERTYKAGETVTFLATANYPAFIEKAEIRILREGREKDGPVAIIPVAVNATADWVMPDAAREEEGDFLYVLRVYDAKGRFDETEPLTVARSAKDLPRHEKAEATAPGMGEDRTARRNIPIHGGAVTVYGRHVPPGFAVSVLGEEIPLDPNQSFVVQRILPPGDHAVKVGVSGPSKSGGLKFTRDINIPDNDWFYVALADLTIGKRTGDDHVEDVRPGEYDEVYSKGRLAFYLKGKIKGKYLLTAAADTGEDELDELFRNLDSQDPRQILRRLDPDDYYPVYGDDSTFVEDAPTKGKFYVRLERGDSHVRWGNYKTEVSGTEFLRSDRALYGASAVYRSEETTSFGERRTEVEAYAAQPDTLPSREEFLGTGGSAYFLQRQDIVEGSETVAVETRDPVTGRVLSRQVLVYGDDYSFDYMQGVIILRRPLTSMTGTASPVRETALGGGKLYLTVNYEYEPVASDVDGYVYGGRAQHWFNDHVRVGVTGMDDSTDMADQKAYGADITLRRSEKTWLKAEIAHSKGRGFDLSQSSDGGLTWGNDGEAYDPEDDEGTAWRVEGEADLQELGAPVKGRIGAYYEEKERGFSTLYDYAAVNRRIWGVDGKVDVTENLTLGFSYDDLSDDDGQSQRNGEGTVSWEFDRHWKVSFGVSYTELMSPRAIDAGKSGYDGSRVDAGVRVDYRIDEDRLVYAFAQGTLDRADDIDRNDRAGIGTEFRLTDKIALSGEVSYGTHGLGALAGITYDPTANDHYYVGYKLDPDRAFDLDRDYEPFGYDKGAIVAGMKRTMGETTSAYSESTYDMFGERHSLTQTYGVIYTPDAMWTVDAGLEIGRVRDNTVSEGVQQEDFDRYAPSLAIGYKDEEAGIKARVRGEVRIERSDDGTRDQNTYLLAAGLSWKTSPDWRLLAHIDAVVSDTQSSSTSFANTDYVEASVGYAYRPVDNEKLNALFKYTWLYDLPGNNQLISGATGDSFAPAQRSHIVSADLIYDLTPWLSVGGKYGFRYSEVKYRTGGGSTFEEEWQASSAHLGVLRADLHLIKSWDVLIEGRALHMPEADTTDWGALAALYRHVGNNFKVGVGYNFGRFSDDLRDLTLDDQGVFLNVVGKF